MISRKTFLDYFFCKETCPISFSSLQIPRIIVLAFIRFVGVKVGVTNLIKIIPSSHVRGRIQGPVMVKSLHQVWVTDERSAKCDQVGMVVTDNSFRGLLCVAAVSDQRTLEDIPEFRQRHRRSQFVKAEGEAVHHMEITKFMLAEAGSRIKKGFAEIGRTHVVEIAIR